MGRIRGVILRWLMVLVALVALTTSLLAHNLILAAAEPGVVAGDGANYGSEWTGLVTVAPPPAGATTTPGPNCRYGAVSWEAEDTAWLPELGVGWRLNFTADEYVTNPGDVEFVPVIRVKQDRDANGGYLPTYTTTPPLTESGLGNRLAGRPGALWIVGNEVDRVDVQDDTYADVYATAYHDVYTFIKERDPSAQVAISGLVQVTAGRLQYLEQMWAAYREQYHAPMPVDVWNMHVYILPEKRADGSGTGAHIALGTDPELAILESGGDPALCPLDNVYCYAEHDDLNLFAEHVVAMRTWMKEHGQQDKPLILSEFSILYVFIDYDNYLNPTTCYLQDEYGNCFTPPRVSDFMVGAFDYLEGAADPDLGFPRDDDRLVQQWMWFSTYVDVGVTGGASNLLTEDLTGLTQMGQTFRDEVVARPLTLNLTPDELAPSVAFTSTPGGTVDVSLEAAVRNNGNTEVTTPFQVSFYADPDLTQLIGTTTIGSVGGCARQPQEATVVWPGLTSGYHHFWVKVDSAAQVSESDEGDNVTSSFVLVNPYQSSLPLLQN
ncbi:MAG: CARDB domain-containing protein [Chloroflexota bacterium]